MPKSSETAIHAMPEAILFVFKDDAGLKKILPVSFIFLLPLLPDTFFRPRIYTDHY